MKNNTKLELKNVISEKSYNQANAQNKYTILVSRGVGKIEVKKAIETKYKVKVVKINSTVRPGKISKNWKTRISSRASDQVKVVVTLKKGDKIDEFLKI